MPKNLLQDIKIKHQPVARVYEMEIRRKESQNERSIKKESSTKPARGTKYGVWIVAIISVFFLLFALSYLFLKVTVTVNPKTEDLVLNENLSGSKDGGEGSTFDLMSVSGEEEKILEAALEKDILKKAEGVVLIYNAFSSASQRLSIDTRLEGSNGKIYKTKKALVVPGMKGDTPGSVEVDIYGAESGEEYNSAPLDFTIFGFRGTPKYAKFYARSKGSIGGGFKGRSPFISEEKETSAMNDLKAILRAKLFKKVSDQIPDGLVLFKDAIFFNTDESGIDPVSSESKSLSLKLKGTLYGFLFDEKKLAQKIAQDKIKGYDGGDVYISNAENLSFSLSNKDKISFAEAKNINFNLKGNAKIVWKLDETAFKTDLLGKSKSDFKQILSQYPNIISADLAISPFWKMTLPTKSKDIKVIVNYPK